MGLLEYESDKELGSRVELYLFESDDGRYRWAYTTDSRSKLLGPIEYKPEAIKRGELKQTAGDSNVRPGHAALDGLVARVDDPIWRRFSPPGGHQCRCVLVSVVGDEVPDGFVTVPPGASFEPGFGTRADLRTYG